MMKKTIVIFALLVQLLFHRNSQAEAVLSDISVGAAKTRKALLAITDPKLKTNHAGPAAKQTVDQIRSNLEFMDIFKVLDPKAYPKDPSNLSAWTAIKVEYLIQSSFDVLGSKNTFHVSVVETFSNREILNKQYIGSSNDLKLIANTASNDIVEALTGRPGVFLSKITMVCDRTGKKEVYIMNFDGSEVKQVTRAKSTTLSPSWSPDGKRLLFSVITKGRNNVKNWNLYEFDLESGKLRLLSNQPGMNSGAVYSPDGSVIALTMSFIDDNPEIFLLDNSKRVTRLTNSIGVDVDPSWSPDGKALAFVSGRTGASMIYRMNADGSNVKRLTFAGTYNATPSWSPAGNKIAFAGWIDKKFDIFIMNPDGTNIERLTQNQGSNEDPHFGPDGNLIVFSSNRSGQKNIYVMNSDGSYTKRLTFGLGNCHSPKWSNPIKR
jgi:TolB protein